MQDLLPFPNDSEREPIGSQQSFPFEHVIRIIGERMDEHARRLDRIHSGQILICAQMKDLRESLPMQRRPLSRFVQQLHIEVVRMKRNGLCPCCQEVPIVNDHGRLPKLEFDHWYNRSNARAEATWAVCRHCNAKLNDTGFKASVRSAFESYQLALRTVIQTRQTTLMDSREPAAS
jgi:hypothetical protein